MLIPEWLLIIVVTGMLGLLGWIGRLLFAIQLAMVGLKTTMDLQLGRIASDIESEKETRARVHSDMEHRIRSLEQRAITLAGSHPAA